MHEPLFISPPGAQILVVFIHGFMGSPRQLDYLATAANAQGCAALSVLLPGHGGTVRDFTNATASDWQAHVDDAITHIRDEYRAIYLVGHSMGGLLALSYAARYPVQGLLLIACPFRLRKFGLFPLKIRLMQLFYPPSHPMKKAYLDSGSVPLSPSLLWRSAGPSAQLRKLTAATEALLPNISAPVTAVFSDSDELVSPASLDVLASGLPKPAVRSIRLPRACHAYYSDADKRLIAAAMLDMLPR